MNGKPERAGVVPLWFRLTDGRITLDPFDVSPVRMRDADAAGEHARKG